MMRNRIPSHSSLLFFIIAVQNKIAFNISKGRILSLVLQFFCLEMLFYFKALSKRKRKQATFQTDAL